MHDIFKIRDDIPMPDDAKAKRAQQKMSNKSWPFKNMKLNQSTLIPHSDWVKAQRAMHSRKHYFGQEFVWTKTDFGVRVWCTKEAPIAGTRVDPVNQRIVWGFSEFKVGDHMTYPAELYMRAKNAMRSSQRTTGFKFEHASNGKRCVFRRVE